MQAQTIKHAPNKLKATYHEISEHMISVWPFESQSGHPSAHVIPNVIAIGLHLMNIVAKDRSIFEEVEESGISKMDLELEADNLVADMGDE